MYPPNQPFYQTPPPPPRRPGRLRRFATWYRRQLLPVQILVGVGILCVASFFCSAAVSGIAQGIAGSTSPTPTPTQSQVTQSRPTTITTAIATPTHVAPTATPTKAPAPTATPTSTPVPVPPTATPTTASNPCPNAPGGNPWCYDFNAPGNLIYTPPTGFCNYFNCIASFYASDDPGDGYIVECQDQTFSQSGGESGSCSHHGGDMRPLYSH